MQLCGIHCGSDVEPGRDSHLSRVELQAPLCTVVLCVIPLCTVVLCVVPLCTVVLCVKGATCVSRPRIPGYSHRYPQLLLLHLDEPLKKHQYGKHSNFGGSIRGFLWRVEPSSENVSTKHWRTLEFGLITLLHWNVLNDEYIYKCFGGMNEY